MKFSQIAAFAISAASTAAVHGFEWERLDKEKAALLVVDHQVGLYHTVHDVNPTVFHNAILAHAAIAKLYDLPIVLTTSAETGPNGPLPKPIRDMYPNATIIRRDGEVNAWDNEAFRDAVRATNRTQLIVGGILTDVCTTFLALSLRQEGFSVWANVEASGTESELVRDSANDQMRAAGVQVVSLPAILYDLMRDWRNVPGAKEVVPYIGKYYSSGAAVFRSHGHATVDGELIPGQADLL